MISKHDLHLRDAARETSFQGRRVSSGARWGQPAVTLSVPSPRIASTEPVCSLVVVPRQR